MIPRLKSLRHRLQHAHAAEDQPLPHLDDLIFFLDYPPPGVRDRWKEGADLCQGWGIETSGAAVWRLYRSYVFEWRQLLACEITASDKTLESIEEKARQLTAIRTFQALADPQLSPPQLVALQHIEIRKQALLLAHQKHKDAQVTKLRMALEKFAEEIGDNEVAITAFHQLAAAVKDEDKL